MKTYTYSEARQRLAALLEQARREGRVQIRRRNGELFVLQPAKLSGSPLDVPGVRVNLRAGELTQWIREGRDASAERALGAALPNPRSRPTGRKDGGRGPSRPPKDGRARRTPRS